MKTTILVFVAIIGGLNRLKIFPSSFSNPLP